MPHRLAATKTRSVTRTLPAALLRVWLLAVIAMLLPACSLESRFYSNKLSEFVTPAGYQDLDITGTSGERIHAWFIPAPSIVSGKSQRAPVVIFCHGSATTIDGIAPQIAPLAEKADASLLLFSYRGFGRSAALDNVTRRTTVDDANAVLAAAMVHPRVDSNAIFLMGYSLGGVPALALAAEHPGVRGVIVGGTYSRAGMALADLDRGAAYPLIGGAFDPADSAAKLSGRPIMIFHAEQDSSAQVYHAYDLAANAAKAGALVTLRIVPNTAHYDVLKKEPHLLDEFAEFIRRALQPVAVPTLAP